MSGRLRAAALSALLVLGAGDGRIELNEAKILAAGGYPYAILQRGSYVLTGSLSVPAGVSGILLQTDGVTLDLNGFAIRGPYTCPSTGNCVPALGAGVGLQPVGGSFLGSQVTLVNGEISGFGEDCVRLNQDAKLEGLVLRHCGANGANVGGGSLLLGNRVSNYGEFGLRMTGPATFSNNALAPTGYGSTPGTPFSGGVSGGGNVCGGPCAPPPKRRFYVTSGPGFNGANAANAGNCQPGFHFASLWEIYDTTTLEYDETLGATLEDSGGGPPTLPGWVRTGNDDLSIPTGTAGHVNCFGWTTASNAIRGTVARPGTIWNSAGEQGSPWYSAYTACDTSARIWCVED